jgi:hypothetical protein
VKDPKHIFDDVHILHLIAFDIQYLLVGVVVISHLHFLLFFNFTTNQKQCIFNYDLLYVLVDWTQLLLGLLRILRAGFMLDVEGRIIV